MKGRGAAAGIALGFEPDAKREKKETKPSKREKKGSKWQKKKGSLAHMRIVGKR